MSARFLPCLACGRRHRVADDRTTTWCRRTEQPVIVTAATDGTPALRPVFRWSENPGELQRLRRRLGDD
jgi:hypothetical protein